MTTDPATLARDLLALLALPATFTRYRAGVPPCIVVEVIYSVDMDAGHLRTRTREIFRPDRDHGWTRNRRNVSRSLVAEAVAGMLRHEVNPTISTVRVYSRSLVWWTP